MVHILTTLYTENSTAKPLKAFQISWFMLRLSSNAAINFFIGFCPYLVIMGQTHNWNIFGFSLKNVFFQLVYKICRGWNCGTGSGTRLFVQCMWILRNCGTVIAITHGNKCRFTVSYNYYCFLNGLVSFAFTRLGAEFY